jgi:hypothetical protein
MLGKSLVNGCVMLQTWHDMTLLSSQLSVLH